MSDSNKTIVVGMSGGIDSTMTAILLKEQSYHVIGATMQVWSEGVLPPSEKKQYACYGPEEPEELVETAELCAKYEIEHRIIDLRKEYQEEVINYFKHEYANGRTPNPCVKCNWKLKFGFLLERLTASDLRFDYFATGHYVRLELNKTSGRYEILKGVDPRKDQSYFIHQLRQEQLARCMFPLGIYTKEQVRSLARERQLPLLDKPESQNFISTGHAALFADTAKPGNIVDQNGRVLGHHKGIEHYTIGQRKGLGVAAPEPLYVLKIDANKNEVVVGSQTGVMHSTLTAGELNWVSIPTPQEPFSCQAKIRYAESEHSCTVYPLANGQIKVEFDHPVMAITPGQSVVFYSGELLLGGGIIG